MENPNFLSFSLPPPLSSSDFSGDERRFPPSPPSMWEDSRPATAPPSFSDSTPSLLEDPCRPLTSMTTVRGGVAGDEDSPDLPPCESIVEETPNIWDLPPESYVDETPEIWDFEPEPFAKTPDNYVEETQGIWEVEVKRVVKKRKKAAGQSSGSAAVPEKGTDLVEIAKKRGWTGSYDLDTLDMLHSLLPAYFRLPTVRSFLSP